MAIFPVPKRRLRIKMDSKGHRRKSLCPFLFVQIVLENNMYRFLIGDGKEDRLF